MSRTSTGSKAYVAMDRSQGRTIFSGVQTYKADGSIDHVGKSSTHFVLGAAISYSCNKRYSNDSSRIVIGVLTLSRQRPSLNPSGASGTHA